MSTQTRRSYLACNAAANATVALMQTLEILSGDKPTQPDDGTSETVLLRFDFGAFAPAENGVVTYPFSNVAMLADGTAEWWRTLDASDNPVTDGPVYATGDTPITGGVELSRVTFTTADTLSGTFVHIEPKTAT